MTLNAETTNTKVIDFEKLCNLVVTTFSFEIIYYFEILFEIKFLKKFDFSF
jgi:hypothetical protein